MSLEEKLNNAFAINSKAEFLLNKDNKSCTVTVLWVKSDGERIPLMEGSGSSWSDALENSKPI